IVAHSMGGLVARAWLRGVDPARVARVITLGTPHGGTWLAGLALSPNAKQMRVGSAWMTGLAGAEPAGRGALFTCWWSDCDQVVWPAPTAELPGATSHFIPGIAHLALTRQPEIIDSVLRHLAQ
ncbi:MAG TPA: permease, partial [Burkholderiaceae bacterium]|nr:permease [Burkholderiaceae bacterium]